MAHPPKPPILKVIMLGDTGVGKTALMHRFVNETFYSNYKPTLGAGCKTRKMSIDEQDVVFQVWDTAGQERFQSLSLSFYRGADCCVLVYDVTTPVTFKSLEHWQDQFLVHAYPPEPGDFPFVVVGNKIDLHSPAVSLKRVQAWCRSKNNIPNVEVSAKNGFNVDLIFTTIARKALLRLANTAIDMDFPRTVVLDDGEPVEGCGDCSC